MFLRIHHIFSAINEVIKLVKSIHKIKNIYASLSLHVLIGDIDRNSRIFYPH